MQILLLAVIATLTLVLNFRRTLYRIDHALGRIDKMGVAIKAQSVYVRTMARKTLLLRRSCRAKMANRDRLHQRCDDIIELIRKTASVDCRLHVLDDRRTRADSGWVAMVSHPGFKGLILPEATADYDRQWRVGRRFIVWAVDRQRALDKVNAAYPADQGFVVASLGPEEEEV